MFHDVANFYEKVLLCNNASNFFEEKFGNKYFSNDPATILAHPLGLRAGSTTPHPVPLEVFFYRFEHLYYAKHIFDSAFTLPYKRIVCS